MTIAVSAALMAASVYEYHQAFRCPKCAKYMRNGKPTYLPQRISDSAYSIVAQYQSEYRGLIQYYRMAYNLHTLAEYKWVMETSLVKTIAKKFNMSCRQIYAQYQTTIETDDGSYKVIQVTVERGPEKKPLVVYFGGISLRWNKKATIDDNQMNFIIWSGRSELVERLLAQKCELCGSTDIIKKYIISENWLISHKKMESNDLNGCRKCRHADVRR